ncbi:hypothetical protein HAPAU_37160 [Halalkalicoccus paucihalophilus]|uniref:Uncharacterized protein n=1 Tax=Halalkalicoccus paucihalophilus TaxID=1008153 RepID=A0A151A9D3_9EURY|nr:hypothetical protein HAPAU_37160 [Halalkalicoccus paucihalophilus]
MLYGDKLYFMLSILIYPKENLRTNRSTGQKRVQVLDANN